ncbi:MAG: glycosyltransferase [Gelidibacter sp.]|nr:glycosyltransferase [Gelidibacter sp.]
MKPKISIITINYNNLEGLKKTVEGVLNQTWQEFEYIIIDGDSTDGSAAYVESKKDLLHYWVSEPDKGVYHAMNKGIAKASGDYLLFLNSGDHFYNKKVLEKNVHFLIDYDLIYFNLYVVGEIKEFIKEYPDTLSFAYFVKDTLPHPATFIKKELFQKYGLYKDNFKIVSDWKFFLDAVCKYQVSYIHINKTLSVFYLGGMSSYPENRLVIFNEKQQVLKVSYASYLQDLDDVLKNNNTITSLKKSRIIKWLIKLGFLNKF